MLFFDLEFYVPPSDRNSSLGSLILNPAHPNHIVLGGCFYRKRLRETIAEPLQMESLWLWNFDDEKSLLKAIYDLFRKEWRLHQHQENEWILRKPVTDVVVCGTGIARCDLPALYCRSHIHSIASNIDLFEVFLKSKSIDLANVASFLFPENDLLYPITALEMAGRLRITEKKGSSKKVWDSYEEGDYVSIENRTKSELLNITRIYTALQKRVTGR
jgi:hypothetical protein